MIAITGGGTGGHLVIAKAIKNEFKKLGVETIFIGSTYGLDQKWFENDKDFKKTYFLDSTGVVNKTPIKMLFSLLNIIRLTFQTRKIFKENGIKAVFSVGGYSSAPASFGAILFRKDLFIHEQNSVIGSLNKLIKPFSKKFFSSFLFKESYPIEGKFFDNQRIRREFKNIIFLGGSQGSVFINNLAFSLAQKLDLKGIKIAHQCGEKHLEESLKRYKNMGIEVDCFGFTEDISLKLQMADLAISRSGASTLFELCANLLPAVFVPYPYAAKDHQFFNAQMLVEKDLAWCFREKLLNEDFILQITDEEVAYKSEQLNNFIKNDGARYIAKSILSEIQIR